MNELQDAWLALIVGVVACGVAWLIGWTILQIIVPRIALHLTDDPTLVGKWDSVREVENRSYTYELRLTSRWASFDGEASISCRVDGVLIYCDEFNAHAKQRGGYVLLSLTGAKQNSSSLATGLFLFKDRGRSLAGTLVYRPGVGSDPATESLTLTRHK